MNLTTVQKIGLAIGVLGFLATAGTQLTDIFAPFGSLAPTIVKEIVSISDSNGALAYEILSLKSANNLGNRVLGNQSRLKFCDTQNVVQIVSAKPQAVHLEAGLTNAQKGNPILNFFAKTGREANAAEHDDAIKPWRRTR